MDDVLIGSTQKRLKYCTVVFYHWTHFVFMRNILLLLRGSWPTRSAISAFLSGMPFKAMSPVCHAAVHPLSMMLTSTNTIDLYQPYVLKQNTAFRSISIILSTDHLHTSSENAYPRHLPNARLRPQTVGETNVI